MARSDRHIRRGKAGHDTASAAANHSPPIDEALLQRVRSEFLEMPGMRLTSPQAQRLLGLDESTCVQLLEWLVTTKFLWRPDDGTYARLTDGYSPRARMAKARMPEHPRSRNKAV